MTSPIQIASSQEHLIPAQHQLSVLSVDSVNKRVVKNVKSAALKAVNL
jgi:hypothetical protein